MALAGVKSVVLLEALQVSSSELKKSVAGFGRYELQFIVRRLLFEANMMPTSMIRKKARVRELRPKRTVWIIFTKHAPRQRRNACLFIVPNEGIICLENNQK